MAELLQNSVDAIIRKGTGKGNIEICINAKKKSIKVKDDGTGINPMQLDLLLNPFSSDKENNPNEGGENGVGVSFVIFQSNDFSIKSRYMDSQYTKTANIRNASTWCSDDENDDFCCNESMKNEHFDGTEVVIQKNDNEQIFELSFEQLVFLIRTKTAVGNVKKLFNKEKININVDFSYIDKSGKQTNTKIQYDYMTPIENNMKRVVLYDDAMSIINDDTITDFEKKNKIKNKIFVNFGTHKESGFTYEFWSCYVPDRVEWQTLNKKANLVNDDEDENPSVMFKPCVTISTKGMPTAIELPQPQGLGNAGYFPNFFIIINDDSYVPDIGRKAVSEDKRNIYNSIVKKQFNAYASKIAPFLKQEEETDFDLGKIEEEIKKAPVLNSKVIKYKCAPFDQEAGVVAIFYELIGTRKCFLDFIPSYSAYRNKYDLYGYFKGKLISVEYKYHLKNIISDLKSYKKMADEINYIVCWNVTEEDEDKINELLNTKIIKVDLDDYDSSKKYMPETTHCISYSDYAKPIYIIDLKEVVLKLNKDEFIYMNIKKNED